MLAEVSNMLKKIEIDYPEIKDIITKEQFNAADRLPPKVLFWIISAISRCEAI